MDDGLKIILREEEIWLSSRRCLWWPSRQTLVVADLHLGKGIAFYADTLLLPPYDTIDTLKRLKELIEELQPQRVIGLGDNFHRYDSFAKLEGCEQQIIHELVGCVPEWFWIHGNHDSELPAILPGLKTEYLNANPFVFYHQPHASKCVNLQIIGHFHPKYKTRLKGHRLSKPCFAWSKDIFILPAFGAYTGGLSIDRPEILKVLEKSFQIATANTYPKPASFFCDFTS